MARPPANRFYKDPDAKHLHRMPGLAIQLFKKRWAALPTVEQQTPAFRIVPPFDC
jgi:hypothetical protein